jgi:uncharacterized protein YecT (DUF1311 family)
MKTFTLLALATFFALTTSGLFAQDQATMNSEAAADAQKADKELNVVYKELMGTLDEEAQALLKTSQRAWIVFRDAEAAFSADEMRGGSASPLLYHGSMTRLTEARTLWLRQRMGEE